MIFFYFFTFPAFPKVLNLSISPYPQEIWAFNSSSVYILNCNILLLLSVYAVNVNFLEKKQFLFVSKSADSRWKNIILVSPATFPVLKSSNETRRRWKCNLISSSLFICQKCFEFGSSVPTKSTLFFLQGTSVTSERCFHGSGVAHGVSVTRFVFPK